MKKAGLAWAAGISLVLAYEAYAVLDGVPGGTLSEFIWAHGQHPMVSFVAGVLIGHFWWQSSARRP